MKNNIFCFGEVLWDVFPNIELPGGAPMNVAIGLSNLNIPTYMISRVGNDNLGKKLNEFLISKNCNNEFVQIDKINPTGVVNVKANTDGHNTYDIVFPSAWDFIEINDNLEKKIKENYALVFGSLACRNEVSKQCILNLINKVNLKIFDVNLRFPFYTQSTIEQLLKLSNIVKMNDEELKIISNWQKIENKTEDEQIVELANIFNIEILIITKGSEGASLFFNNKIIKNKGYKVKVIDTVGSGDAFLAGFLSQYYKNKNIDYALNFACALGALVATFQGANNLINEQDITNFILQQNINS